MPDRRQHRGPHPEDAALFAPDQLPRLRAAVSDLCWLLNRGYAPQSSLTLVGDRFGLAKRQRIAVARCSCSEEARQRRLASQVDAGQLAGQVLLIDGYNVLTTVEAALAAGVLLLGRDGCLRDMASVHGSFRTVSETLPALKLLGRQLSQWQVAQCRWLFDSPVSNSGRLKRLVQELAAECDWDWQVELVASPDRLLKSAEHIVATSDSHILDAAQRWANVARMTVENMAPGAFIIHLSAAH